MPLSDVTIRNLKPREKPYKVSDFDGLFWSSRRASGCGSSSIDSMARKDSYQSALIRRLVWQKRAPLGMPHERSWLPD